jgi:hypothetical protein
MGYKNRSEKIFIDLGTFAFHREFCGCNELRVSAALADAETRLD